MKAQQTHYLKEEFFTLLQTDIDIFHFLQEGSLDGLWYWDIEHPEHEWMDPQFWRLLGFNPDEKEHLASEWQDLINPEDLDIALANFNLHCQDPNHPYDQIVRYTHKDGSTVWVRCRGIAIRDDDGTPVRMLGIHNDLTAQKRVEEELRQKTKELEEANTQLQAKIEGLLPLLPICSSCKKIRDDEDTWTPIDLYVRTHSNAEFTHGYCPDCFGELFPDITYGGRS